MSDSGEFVPFNRVHFAGGELRAIEQAVIDGHISADGPFSERCTQWLQRWSGSDRALLMPSCTAALEAAAMLIDAGPGDEIVMPSYTFSSTASAFVMRGATPVFVDIRPDTLNLDETLVEDAITDATTAIVPVHYGGIGCEMEPLAKLAAERGLSIVEDAAQGILAEADGRPLGSQGRLGALSFHETKDVTCGEGGALLVNDESLIERAEILRDKGTNRRKFFRGEVDKYTWVDLGSSFGLSDLNAAFLWAQLEAADRIKEMRLAIWTAYHEAFASLETDGVLRRPVVPEGRSHNAHLYYLLLPDGRSRDAFLQALREREIDAVFHYVPLHSSPAGRRWGRPNGSLAHTDDLAARIVRLPLWAGMSDAQLERVIEGVHSSVASVLAGRPV